MSKLGKLLESVRNNPLDVRFDDTCMVAIQDDWKIRELIMKDHHTVEVFWSDEDKGFIAFVHELKGCSAWGETREAALREVEIAIELWIEAAKEIGGLLPLPNPPFAPGRSK